MKKLVLNPKEPVRLYKERVLGGSQYDPTCLWICGECGQSYPSRLSAFHCCKLKACADCGKEGNTAPFSTCSYCRAKEHKEAEKRRWEKMPTVPYNDGPICVDDMFHDNLNEAFDFYADNQDDYPDYVELCKEEIITHGCDAKDIVDNICMNILDDMDDGYSCELDHQEELIAAVKSFLENQTMYTFVRQGKKIDVEEYVNSLKQEGEKTELSTDPT